MIGRLRAGILTAAGSCLHCSRPLEQCRCAQRDLHRPHHGLAEAFLGLSSEKPRGLV